MEGDTFQQWKNQCLNKSDFSKKGSVDEDISHIVSFINNHDKYFTTSSCSGRIILFDGVRQILFQVTYSHGTRCTQYVPMYELAG